MIQIKDHPSPPSPSPNPYPGKLSNKAHEAQGPARTTSSTGRPFTCLTTALLVLRTCSLLDQGGLERWNQQLLPEGCEGRDLYSVPKYSCAIPDRTGLPRFPTTRISEPQIIRNWKSHIYLVSGRHPEQSKLQQLHGPRPILLAAAHHPPSTRPKTLSLVSLPLRLTSSAAYP